MKRKNGDVTVGTLVAIVLAIVVIAFLVYGFSTGWTNLWGKVTDFGGGNSNVDDIVLACNLACAQQRTNEFCETSRVVRYGEDRNVWNGTAFESQDSVTKSCKELTNRTAYSVPVESCSQVNCN
jgi:hypothetical protein